jgi:hypothetical protein
MSPTAVLNLHKKSYPCTYRVVTYSPHKEYRELPALGRKIDIFKLTYRYLLAFGR